MAYIGGMGTEITTDRNLIQIDPSCRIPSQIASQIVQFRTRKEAERAARSIGWSACDATEIDVMGFRLWTIMESHNLAVTRDGFTFWSA